MPIAYINITVCYICFSQNATAVLIQPSATAPVPKPKPCGRPSNI